MPPREESGADVDPVIVSSLANGKGGKILPARRPMNVTTLPDIKGVADSWFGPLNPLPSNAPDDVKGRSFDFPVGYNITTNKERIGQPSTGELRNLARMCDLVTLAIETRKDQMEQYNLHFKVKNDRAGKLSANDPRVKEVEAFFSFPDKRRTTNRWIRKLMDDLMILDAPCVWVQRSVVGKPLQMRVIDTATIKPLIGADGEIPLAPDPGFQQWLKGVPAGNYTADEMVWHPRNPRSDKIFGFSPVEQVYITVNTAIRRQLLVLAGYTEGSIPEAIIPVPEDWNQDRITEFQIYWDAILSGQLGQQRHVRFVPAGVDKAIFPKKFEDKGAYDEWLARVIMYAFSLSSSPFTNQVNRSTAEMAQQTAVDEGLVPMINYWKEFFNLLVWKFWGYLDLEATFKRENTSNAKEQAEADKIRTDSGHISIDELRTEELGRDAIGQGPAVMTTNGLVGIGDNAPKVAPAAAPVAAGVKKEAEPTGADLLVAAQKLLKAKKKWEQRHY